MRCNQCGVELPTDTTACPHCAQGMAIPPPPAPAMSGQITTPPRTSGLAIASLILGILGCTSLIGLILGIISLVQVRGSRGRLTGAGLAIAGTAISAIMLVGGGVLTGIGIQRAKTNIIPQAKEAMLISYLDMMRESIREFKDDTGVCPATLDDIVVKKEADLRTKVPSGSYKGPYFPPKRYAGVAKSPAYEDQDHPVPLPLNPFGKLTDTDISHHWKYDPATGTVKSAIERRTQDGKALSEF